MNTLHSTPWEVLGVPRGTPINDVRKAWQQQVRQWHPDRNPDPTATDRLQAINQAYQDIQKQPGNTAGSNFDTDWSDLMSAFDGLFRKSFTAERVNLAINWIEWALDHPLVYHFRCRNGQQGQINVAHPHEIKDGATLSTQFPDGSMVLATFHIVMPNLGTLNAKQRKALEAFAATLSPATKDNT